jgi:hypothetical protein
MPQTSGNLSQSISTSPPEYFFRGMLLPRPAASCRNCLAVSLADKRQAVAKDAILAARLRSSIDFLELVDGAWWEMSKSVWRRAQRIPG